MTDRQDGTDKVTITVDLDLGAVGVLRPAPGDSGEPPDHVRVGGDIGTFAQLLALEDIPAWSGHGAVSPPGVLDRLDRLPGPPAVPVGHHRNRKGDDPMTDTKDNPAPLRKLVLGGPFPMYAVNAAPVAMTRDGLVRIIVDPFEIPAGDPEKPLPLVSWAIQDTAGESPRTVLVITWPALDIEQYPREIMDLVPDGPTTKTITLDNRDGLVAGARIQSYVDGEITTEYATILRDPEGNVTGIRRWTGAAADKADTPSEQEKVKCNGHATLISRPDGAAEALSDWPQRPNTRDRRSQARKTLFDARRRIVLTDPRHYQQIARDSRAAIATIRNAARTEGRSLDHMETATIRTEETAARAADLAAARAAEAEQGEMRSVVAGGQLLGGGQRVGSAAPRDASSQAFLGYLKTGDVRDTALSTTDANGGYIVSEPLHAQLIEKVRKVDPIFDRAHHFDLSGGNDTTMILPKKSANGAVSTATETGPRSEQTEPTFAGPTLSCFDYYTDQRATQQFLDSVPDAETMLLTWIYEDIFEQFGVDLACGTGSTSAIGLFSAVGVSTYATMLSGSGGRAFELEFPRLLFEAACAIFRA